MARNRRYRVDFADIKRAVPLEHILSHYGVLDAMKRSGSQLTGCCPIHKGSNRRQFVVDLTKNSWRCFGDCDRGGGTLELVAEIERVDIAEAARRIARWFGIEHRP
jgi:DNA primase